MNIWHQGPWPPLVQVIACRLFGAKPLSEPRIILSIEPRGTQTWVKIESDDKIFFKKRVLKISQSPAQWRPFCSGLYLALAQTMAVWLTAALPVGTTIKTSHAWPRWPVVLKTAALSRLSIYTLSGIFRICTRAVDCNPVVMMTSSNGNIFRVTGPLCGEFTGHRWIPRTKASDAELWCFLWSAPRINGWVNNREAGDLRRQRAHYDVIVMMKSMCIMLSAVHNNLQDQAISLSPRFNLMYRSQFIWCSSISNMFMHSLAPGVS